MTGELGRLTCYGEYEALKSVASFCRHSPEPYGWGEYVKNDVTYSFLLVEFLSIKIQVTCFKSSVHDLNQNNLLTTFPARAAEASCSNSRRVTLEVSIPNWQVWVSCADMPYSQHSGRRFLDRIMV